MKEINIQGMYSKLDTETKEIYQSQNFDSKCFALQNEIQDLYDNVFVNGDMSFENKAKLDLIFTYVGEVIRQGEELLKKTSKN
jgi:hypothetical protein